MNIKDFKKVARLLKQAYAELEELTLKNGGDLLSEEYEQVREKVRLAILEKAGVTLEEYLGAKNQVLGLSKEELAVVEQIQQVEKRVEKIEKVYVPNEQDIEAISERVAKKYIVPPQIINQIVKETTVEKPTLKTVHTKEEVRIEYDDKDIRKKISDVESKIPEWDISALKSELLTELENRFSDNFRKNIDTLGMPDFRKMGMGLKQEIDEVRALANSSSGDVVGPASSTDNAIARFDGTTGKLIQDYTSGAPTVSDTGVVRVNTLGVGIDPIGSGEATIHVGTNQNFQFDNAGGAAILQFLTDAGSYTTGQINSSLLKLNNFSEGSISTGGHLIWEVDNVKDIGASGATRPRTGYFGTSISVGGGVVSANTLVSIKKDQDTTTQLAISNTSTGTASKVALFFESDPSSTNFAEFSLNGANNTTLGGAKSFNFYNNEGAIAFLPGGTLKWSISTTGHLVPGADATYDIGTSTVGINDLHLGSGGVINFDGGDVTLTHGANVLTLAGGDLALGANSLTMTGSLAATGARVTKGWFTDIESTNMPTVGGTAILTSLTAPQFTTIELGHATENTLSASSGNLSIEGNLLYRAGGTDVPVADGGTGRSTATAYGVIIGGTTDTGAHQSVALGTSGQVLTSNGAGAAPTFQDAGGGGMALLGSATFNTTATNANFTADAGTDVITSAGHNLQNGDKVVLTTTGTLPAGLATSTAYYVRDKTTDTFKLSATNPFAAAVDITDAGSGTHTWTNQSGTIVVSGLAAKNWLKIKVVGIKSGTARVQMLFNEDGAANYGIRTTTDGGAGSSSSAQTSFTQLVDNASTASHIANMEVMNFTAKQKIATWIGSSIGTTAINVVTTGSGVWNNTSDQISQVVVFAQVTQSFDSGAMVYVYGQD